ncbi:MAG: GNAT family N-acetyltransferase [Anaerolineales bacterium]|jgi:ribosomal protein S18 acetylase RimI-like enzyme
MDKSKQQIHVELIKKVDTAFISQLNSLLDEGTEWDSRQGEKFLKDPSNALFVAFLENRAVGFLTANRLQRFDKRGAEVLLHEIGVNEDFRRRGIGKALIDEVKHWAKEAAADEVWVLTNRSNTAAVALCQSEGGTTESKTPDEVMFVFKLYENASCRT